MSGLTGGSSGDLQEACAALQYSAFVALHKQAAEVSVQRPACNALAKFSTRHSAVVSLLPAVLYQASASALK